MLALLLVRSGDARAYGGSSWRSELAKADSLQQVGRSDEAGQVLDSAVAHARMVNDPRAYGQALLHQALQYQLEGEDDRALTVLYQALAWAKDHGDEEGLAAVYNSIGALQHAQKNYAKAEAFYRRSGAIVERLGLERETAKYWNNLGSLYEDMGKPAEAIGFHRRSLGIWEALRDTGWVGISYMHLGTCHEMLGNVDSARTYLEGSIHMLNHRNSEYQLSLVYILYGVNENRAGRRRSALAYCSKGLAMANSMNIRPFEQQACDCLSEAYDALGDKGRALVMLRRSTALRDSLFGEAKVKEMTRIEMDHDFAQKQLADSLTRAKRKVELELRHQAEMTAERESRNIAIFGGIAVLVLAGGLWSRLRYMRLSRARIQRERERSERLLLNILPGAVAQELKDKGSAKARDFESVTILFSDFKGFTQFSETMSAHDLVEELHTCFMAFDGIMGKYGVEKIKTIGDAYMCAGGIPEPGSCTPADVVHAALEMQDFIVDRKKEREAQGKPAFQMRVGIHTGPVVAGIVGVKKFAYDIWGDTVNTASRMESSGEAGRVNISEATYALVKDAVASAHWVDREPAANGIGNDPTPAFTFTPRGKIQAKGKGEMEMYFVSRG